MRYLLVLCCLFGIGYAEDKFYWPEPTAPYNEPDPFIEPVEVDKDLEKPAEVHESEDMQKLEEGNIEEGDENEVDEPLFENQPL